MALESGKLRHRIKIQKPAETRDPETGDVKIAWRDFATVWASVEPLSVREFLSAQSMQSEVSVRVVIRYRAGLTAQMRILFRDRILNPAGWFTDPVSGLEFASAPCSEGVNDGR